MDDMISFTLPIRSYDSVAEVVIVRQLRVSWERFMEASSFSRDTLYRSSRGSPIDAVEAESSRSVVSTLRRGSKKPPWSMFW